MKRFILIGVGLLVFLVGCFLFSSAATPKLTWQVFDDQMPAAAADSGLRLVQVESDNPESIPLPLGLRLWECFASKPPVAGTPVAKVTWYRLLSERGGAVNCVARCYEDRVARVVVSFPKAGRASASTLRDALRRRAPGLRVELREYRDP